MSRVRAGTNSFVVVVLPGRVRVQPADRGLREQKLKTRASQFARQRASTVSNRNPPTAALHRIVSPQTSRPKLALDNNSRNVFGEQQQAFLRQASLAAAAVVSTSRGERLEKFANVQQVCRSKLRPSPTTTRRDYTSSYTSKADNVVQMWC